MMMMTSTRNSVLIIIVLCCSLSLVLGDFSVQLDDDDGGVGGHIVADGSEWDAAEAEGRHYRAEQNALQRENNNNNNDDDNDDDDDDQGWIAVQSTKEGGVPDQVLKAAYAAVRLLEQEVFLEWGSTGLRLELDAAASVAASSAQMDDWVNVFKLFELVRIWGADELIVGDRVKYRIDVDVVNPLFKTFENYAAALNLLGKETTLEKFAKWSRIARDSDPKYSRRHQHNNEDDAPVDFDQVEVAERTRQIRAFLMAIDPTKFHLLVGGGDDSDGLPGEQVERWIITVLRETTEDGEPRLTMIDKQFVSETPVNQVFTK